MNGFLHKILNLALFLVLITVQIVLVL